MLRNAPRRIELERTEADAVFGRNSGKAPTITLQSVTEAKAFIIECRMRKKELQAQKKSITPRQQELRAAHTNYVREHATVGKGLGSLLMGSKTAANQKKIQSMKHAQHRQQLARDLTPLETAKAAIDRSILEADLAIARAQAHIERQKP